MEKNTQEALDLILRWEGPEINIANSEPGGISKYGISLQTYNDYCIKNKLPRPDMNTIANMPEDKAREFYKDAFLPAIKFNNLPEGVDIRMADCSISLGITGAINLLCMALRQYPLLNTMTDELIALASNTDPCSLISCLSTGWIAEKHTKANTTSWNTFGNGWSKRNTAVTNQCLSHYVTPNTHATTVTVINKEKLNAKIITAED